MKIANSVKTRARTGNYSVSMKTNAARAPSAKLDLYQINKADYATPRNPVLLRIAKAAYLGIAGRGRPGGEAFEQAIGALYSVAFTIKMASKFAGRDYGVCKLEGLWWVDSGRTFMTEPKDHWSWRLLIRTPDFIGERARWEPRGSNSRKRAKGRSPKRSVDYPQRKPVRADAAYRTLRPGAGEHRTDGGLRRRARLPV